MLSQDYIKKVNEILNSKNEYSEDEMKIIATELLNFYKIILEIMESNDNFGKSQTKIQKTKNNE